MTPRRAALFAALVGCACAPRPGLDEVDPPLETLGKGLPAGFLLGAATAAHQVEGGNDNDWTDWEKGAFEDGTPHVQNGDQSGLAADSWNRFDEDLKLLQQLGATSYRFSVEWSRLEPTKGAWNQQAMDRYKAWTRRLRDAGIEPMVTLWHFTLPKWVAAQGAFENRDTLADFTAFSRRVGAELGPTVDLWCTINEPNVYAVQGYLEGTWPPGKKDDTKTQTVVLANVLEAHGLAAKALREVDVADADGDGKPALISVAHHVRIIQPASHDALDMFIAGLTDDYFNEATARALKTGRILLDVPGTITIDRRVPELVGSTDYLGINYYTRYIVRADLGAAALSQQYYRPGAPTNDLGWEIYPDGLYTTLKRFSAYGWPLYVTENGMPDEGGGRRVLFLKQHVAAVERAVAEGADVRGYLHWSLIDNFEWAEGFEPRFGLFTVDYAQGRARTATAAVPVFRRIAQNAKK